VKAFRPLQRRILEALYEQRHGGPVGVNALIERVYRDPDLEPDNARKIIHVSICSMRPGLAARGCAVIPYWGRGYRLVRRDDWAEWAAGYREEPPVRTVLAQILMILCRRRHGGLVSRAEIHAELRSSGRGVAASSVCKYITKLRRALEGTSLTIPRWRRGYQLVRKGRPDDRRDPRHDMLGQRAGGVPRDDRPARAAEPGMPGGRTAGGDAARGQADRAVGVPDDPI